MTGARATGIVAGTLGMLLAAAPARAETAADGPAVHFQQGVIFDLLLYSSFYHNSPVNPSVYASKLSGFNDTLYGTYTAQATYGNNLSGAVSVLGSLDQTTDDGLEKDGQLLTGYVTLTDDSHTTKVTLGKQLIKWSQDTTFHPLDLFGRFNQPRSNVGLNEYNPYLSEGVYALRVSGHRDVLGWDVVAADAQSNTSYPANWQIAGKLDFELDGNAVDLIGEWSQGYDPRFGASVSKVITDNWMVYGEYLYYRHPTVPVLTMTAPVQPVGPVTLPAAWSYSHDAIRNRQDFLLTVRHSFADGGLADLSYFHNGSGYGGEDWADLRGVVNAAYRTFVDPAFLPFYPAKYANPNAAILGDTANLLQAYYFRINYLNLHLDTLERLPQLRLQANLLCGLDDGGLTLQVTASHDIGAHLTVSLFAIGQTLPKNSENAVSPYSGSIGTLLHAVF